MKVAEIGSQLEAIKSADDFTSRCTALAASWSAANLGLDAVEPILSFMEENQIDFGQPGPLVRYVERWFGKGYEEKLVESIRRKPTPHTVWMLNRVINGVKDSRARRRLVTIMEEIKANPAADEEVLQEVDFFLGHL